MAHDLRQRFVDELGALEWDDSYDAFSKMDPEFFKASTRLMAVPKRNGHLSPKLQALISLTVNANATHLATLAEIKEVIQLASTLGIHACNVGVPTLVEVMKEEGLYESHQTCGKPFDIERVEMQKEFVEKRGYWHAFWEEFLALDPKFFSAYTEFSSVPWMKKTDKQGREVGLEPMAKELIYCAFDAAATHLYRPGLKEHMRNALRYGATIEQILEVLEIATLLSVHTANMSYPILARCLEGTS